MQRCLRDWTEVMHMHIHEEKVQQTDHLQERSLLKNEWLYNGNIVRVVANDSGQAHFPYLVQLGFKRSNTCIHKYYETTVISQFVMILSSSPVPSVNLELTSS